MDLSLVFLEAYFIYWHNKAKTSRSYPLLIPTMDIECSRVLAYRKNLCRTNKHSIIKYLLVLIKMAAICRKVLISTWRLLQIYNTYVFITQYLPTYNIERYFFRFCNSVNTLQNIFENIDNMVRTRRWKVWLHFNCYIVHTIYNWYPACLNT